ncbi:uncharacterized protein LOC128683870 isoform X2 [Plodia interpunctella]|uniref:uncharacterized protein LOC128683870 isoform X2 n=1 Tax=Plodia interpunctella TaxID=58824 RepID=UPI00236833C0|nr:uncharacterized protein LOC128683870 isoform X2 [Plodia interpunctella]
MITKFVFVLLFVSSFCNEKLIFRSVVHAYNTLKLTLPIVYEFDNRSTLMCEVLGKQLTTINNTKLIVKDRNYWNRKPIVSNHMYKDGNSMLFNCKHDKDPLHNSLHWIIVNDKYITQNVISDYSNYKNYSNDKTLTYQINMTKDDNGNRLICIYFQCEIYDKTAVCKRFILKDIRLIMTTNENSDGNPIGMISGGVAIMAGISLVIAALIWYRIRKYKVKDEVESTIQYIEVDFSDNLSTQSRPPVRNDEVLYSKVTGVITPGQDKY